MIPGSQVSALTTGNIPLTGARTIYDVFPDVAAAGNSLGL